MSFDSLLSPGDCLPGDTGRRVVVAHRLARAARSVCAALRPLIVWRALGSSGRYFSASSGSVAVIGICSPDFESLSKHLHIEVE